MDLHLDVVSHMKSEVICVIARIVAVSIMNFVISLEKMRKCQYPIKSARLRRLDCLTSHMSYDGKL